MRECHRPKDNTPFHGRPKDNTSHDWYDMRKAEAGIHDEHTFRIRQSWG